MRTHNTNSLAATRQLLAFKGVNYETDRLKDDLLGHPDYPSLFAVHHVLNQYGVTNSPVEVNAESLDELGQPFLAYMQLPGVGYDFALVNKVQNGSITFTNTKGRPETISREDFFSKWKNVAVMVDNVSGESLAVSAVAPVSESRNRNWNQNLTKTIGAIALVALVVVASLNAATPLIFAPWLLLKMAGLAVTVLLLMYEADRQNETVKQFCSAGKTVNCDAVLQSKGAKIGPFSWSEMGFAYFAGSFLYLLFAANTTNFLVPLALLSLAVLPYTVYSIYYQYKVVKQWCRLCLFIQGIILVEAAFTLSVILLPADWQVFNWQVALLLLPLLALPLVSWLAVKPALQKAATADSYKYAYIRLQNNPEVFTAMLNRQAAAPVGYKKCGIPIGNPNASQTIIKICNPYCGPCAAAHPILENIVEHHDVNIYILFTGTNNEADKGGLVAKHFIALHQAMGAEAAQKAMHYWYGSDKNILKLREQYPVINAESESVKQQLELMNKWDTEADIQFTPTVYVNGHRLPETYTIKQLEKMYGYE